MRTKLRQLLSVLAIYAVALHAVFSPGAPLVAAADGEPLVVICHSGAAGPAPSVPSPQRACDHCTLCGTVAPPPPAVAVVDDLRARDFLQVLRPASTAPGTAVAFHPNLARGPPLRV